MRYECGNCDWETDEFDDIRPLFECPNLNERLNPGSKVPEGDCPECNCFVYDKESEITESACTAKLVTTLTITDPDTNMPVAMEVWKLSNGAIMGVDASYLENTDDDVFNPYQRNALIVTPE